MEGGKEVTGGADLIRQHKLLPQYDYFCKKSLPLSISDSHYLYNVVGDTEIKTGVGMQLDQLIKDGSVAREAKEGIQPFDIGVLGEAFRLKEAGPIHLPLSERGIPTIPGKSKDKKHKKHRDKDKDKERDKEHKKHKHRHKDRSKDKDKEKKKEKSGHHEKKRKRN